MCSTLGWFIGPLKRITLHYGLWGKKPFSVYYPKCLSTFLKIFIDNFNGNSILYFIICLIRMNLFKINLISRLLFDRNKTFFYRRMLHLLLYFSFKVFRGLEIKFISVYYNNLNRDQCLTPSFITLFYPCHLQNKNFLSKFYWFEFQIKKKI